MQVIADGPELGGFFIANGAVFRDGDGKSYTDILPQLNFAFLLDNDQSLRFGLAEELARPPMDQLKATEESGTTAQPASRAAAAATAARPWRAWAFDLSYEKYFASAAATSRSRRSTRTSTATSSRRPTQPRLLGPAGVTPPGLFAPGVTPQTTGNFSQPVNGNGGYL